uniref:forkhead box protein M1 isoform X2 n=1 Tax=Doryrhamphus excisus TaxID=161450 RepID=UPI0025ADC991|nr:forkhead box protein M1 isoform X2 [Doryrhamphus excisus]
MRRSPRRPLILKRRKLPFQQHDPPPRSPKESATSPPSSRSFPDGIRILDHPSLPNTQVVVIPKTADLQSVIEALTVKGKECGAQGRNKFILLGESGSLDSSSLYQAKTEDVFTGIPVGQQQSGPSGFTGIKQYKNEENDVAFDSAVCMQQQESSGAFQAGHDAPDASKEKQTALQVPECEKPPFSYMTMIQFAINSHKDGHMTLKEIYKWLQDHFPFFRDETKNGWKNSVRHNLSLHNMFLRKPSPYRSVSFWTIRPEANRGLTLDQVYKPGCDPVPAPYAAPMLPFCYQQMPTVADAREDQSSLGKLSHTDGGPVHHTERRTKPLPPRAPSCLVPMQLPVSTSSLAAHTPPSHSSPAAKRPRKAPQVAQSKHCHAPSSSVSAAEVKAKAPDVPAKRKSPRAPAKRQAKGSRRKQRLVHSLHDEPVLVYSERSGFDSGIATSPTFLDSHGSPDRLFSDRTPVKTSSSRLTSSTPSKPRSGVLPEPWKVTPSGKEGRSVLDFSPIRTPSGPASTPLHDYTTFSLSGTPLKDWPVFCSPAASPSNHSLTEALILDTMNDSLSKILVDFSFTLEDEDLALADVSLSEIIPQLK